MRIVSDSSHLVVGHSRMLAVLDDLTFMENVFWPPSPDPFDSIEPSISMKIEISMFSIRNVFLTLRTDKQASKQTIFSKTLLDEKEKNSIWNKMNRLRISEQILLNNTYCIGNFSLSTIKLYSLWANDRYVHISSFNWFRFVGLTLFDEDIDFFLSNQEKLSILEDYVKIPVADTSVPIPMNSNWLQSVRIWIRWNWNWCVSASSIFA